MKSDSTALAGRKPVILVADDDEDLLLVMQLKMKAEGCTVLVSSNAQDIFDILARNVPDMILLDITMDGVSGADICKQLKSQDSTRNIPVLMFSANHNIAQLTVECGADDFLTKPFDILQLKEKIANVMNRPLS